MGNVERVGALKHITRRFDDEGKYSPQWYAVSDGDHAVSFAMLVAPPPLVENIDGPYSLGAHIDGVPMLAMDLGYHSAEPLEKDYHGTRIPECPDLNQGWCWYDGSTMPAVFLLKEWAKAGATAEWLWDRLELIHRERFSE